VPPVACGVAAHPLLDADPAKSGSLVEGQARVVLDEYTCKERPDARFLGGGHEGREQGAPDAAPARRGVDIDALPGDTRVHLSGRVAPEGRPTDDPAVPVAGDQPAIAPVTGLPVGPAGR